MSYPPISRLLRRLSGLLIVALSAGLLLASCKAFADVSADVQGDALGERAPAFIERGVTTRAQIEQALGAPAVSAPDGRWAFHESSFIRGGSGVWASVWFAGALVDRLPLPDAMRLRRLLIRYDDAGVVTASEFEAAECSDLKATASSRRALLKRCPILARDVAMRDLRQADHMRLAFGAGAADAANESPARWFRDVMWEAGAQTTFRLWCGPPHGRPGALLGVGAEAVVFLPQETASAGPAGEVPRVLRRDIVRAEAIDGVQQQNVGIRLVLAGGSEMTITLCRSTEWGWHQDTANVEAVLGLLGTAGSER
jgi:hypothetical protein